MPDEWGNGRFGLALFEKRYDRGDIFLLGLAETAPELSFEFVRVFDVPRQSSYIP